VKTRALCLPFFTTLLTALFLVGCGPTTRPQDLRATQTSRPLPAAGTARGPYPAPPGGDAQFFAATPGVNPPVLSVPLADAPTPLPTPTLAPVTYTADGWEIVAPGVSYRPFTDIPGAVHPIHVARLARDTEQYPNLTVDTLLAGGVLQPWVIQSLSGQVRLYEDSLNYWGDLSQGGQPYWGKRNHILVALNGALTDTQDTFDIHNIALTLEGLPNQGMVQSGWYFDHFQEFQSRSGFVWTMGRQAFIGGCVFHPSAEQTVRFNPDDPESEIKLSGVNIPRSADRGIFLYTSHWGTTTGQEPRPNETSVEVVVRLTSPLVLLPAGENRYLDEEVVTGRVLEIRTNQEPASIEFDQVVLAAYGLNGDKLKNLAETRLGRQIQFSTRLTDGLPENCQKPSGKNWSEAYAALGVDVTLVADGEPIFNPSGIAPRSAVAGNDQYLYLVLAEGRPTVDANGEPDRTGMALYDLSVFLVTELDAEWAANLDGGGSSTLLINGRVVNQPGDSLPMICRRMYLSGVMSAGGTGETGGETFESEPTPRVVYGVTSPNGVCQRPVVNSLAFVAVEPMIRDTNTLQVGDTVITARVTPVRQGPGINYQIFEALPAGTKIEIVRPASGLNGIYASGAYWWYIESGARRGWVQMDHLGREP
jgi:hypothetical protein